MPVINEDVIIENHGVSLRDAAGNVVARLDPGDLLIVLDPDQPRPSDASSFNASLTLGIEGRSGEIVVRDRDGRTVFHAVGGVVQAGDVGRAGDIQVRASTGAAAIQLSGGVATITAGSENREGHVIVRDAAGRDAIHLDGSDATVFVGGEGNEGDLTVRDEAGRNGFQFSAQTATLTIGGSKQGRIIVRDIEGRDAVQINGSDASVFIGGDGTEGDLVVRDVSGDEVFHMSGDTATLVVGARTNPGDIIVRDGSGVDRIALNGADGDIKLLGADLAEDFDTLTAVEPGAVVVAIDVDRIAPAATACDRRVVGVASGAGAFRPALRLGTRFGTNRVPVAIVGRVYCQADARHGAIVAGDLLTTSTTAGHAMRVGDPAAAAGAILGKALGPLAQGTGLIPVLLTLG
jgi:hypothetical protein